MKLGLFATPLKLSFAILFNKLITTYYLRLHDFSHSGGYFSTCFLEVDRNILKYYELLNTTANWIIVKSQVLWEWINYNLF